MWGRFPTFFYSRTWARDNMNDALEHVVTQELDTAGYDLVELRKGGTRSRPVLEVRIDRRDGGRVTVDDCARASRAIEARLDAGDLVAERYVLQVSSPGERPLRTPAEWRRFVGRWANVLAPDFGGRLEGEILSVEDGEEGTSVVLRPERGEAKRIPLAAVREARLAFRFS
ncbi:MAG TPA: ribosome maturation factor RimP [Gemmatimonadaceae bacterium]